jgi:hypothetical protein
MRAIVQAAEQMVAEMDPVLQDALFQRLLEARAVNGQHAMQPNSAPMDLDYDQPSHNEIEHDALVNFDSENHNGMPHAFTWAKKARTDTAPQAGAAGTSSRHISDYPISTSITCVACTKRGSKECAGKYCRKCCIAHSCQNEQYHCKVHRAAAHQTPVASGAGHVVIAMPPQVRGGHWAILRGMGLLQCSSAVMMHISLETCTAETLTTSIALVAGSNAFV